MPNAAKRYELTTSLSINSTSVDVLDDYVERLENALVVEISGYETVTAYFVSPDHESVEIKLGLRFEGMEPRLIEDAATRILDQAIARASGPTHSQPVAVREESTLVPA